MKKTLVVVAASLFILIACSAQEVSKQHFIEGSLKKAELDALVTKSKRFSLPQFRVYDRQGRQIADFGDGFADNFPAQLDKVFKSPKPTKSETTLHDELVKVVGADRKPLPDFPEFQFAIVEYWASWCEPCKAQAEALRKVLAAHKDLAVNVFHVEADPMKTMEIYHGKKKK